MNKCESMDAFLEKVKSLSFSAGKSKPAVPSANCKICGGVMIPIVVRIQRGPRHQQQEERVVVE